MSSIEGKEEAKGNTTQVGAIKAYREKIEKELADSKPPPPRPTTRPSPLEPAELTVSLISLRGHPQGS